MAYTLISVIDTTAEKKLADIKIDSDSVEAMALEKSGPRMFANLKRQQCCGGDRPGETNRNCNLVHWKEGKRNAAMAFDEANNRLFVVARDPGKIIVMDSDSGKIVPPSLRGHTDDAVYDPGSKRLYVSGVPFLYVYEQRHPNRYSTNRAGSNRFSRRNGNSGASN